MTAKPQPLVLTIEEVCQLVGKSRRQVRRSIREGSMPTRKWGQLTVVLYPDLLAFLESLPLNTPNPEGSA